MLPRYLGIALLSVCATVNAQTIYDINANGTWITPGTWTPASGVSGPLETDHIAITGLAATRTVSLRGDETNQTTAGTYTIASLRFDQDDFNATFAGVGGSGAPTLNITGDLTKDGAASLFFQNRSSGGNIAVNVGGDLLVNSGTLDFGAAGAHGTRAVTVSGSTTIKAGATLNVSTITSSSLGNTTVETGAALLLQSNNNSVNFTLGALVGPGDITVLNGNTQGAARSLAVIFDSASGDHVYSGTLTGSAIPQAGALTLGLRKDGAGRQVLTGSLAGLNGLVTINGGVLEFSGASSLTTGNINLAGGVIGLGTGDLARTLGDAADQVRLTAANSGFAAYGADRTVTLSDNAGLTWGLNNSRFMTAGSNQQVNNLVLNHESATHKLTFTNAINLNNAARTVTVGDGAAVVDATLTGVLSGTGASALVKAGDGSLALTAANTYVGGTTISAGTLLAENTAGSATGDGAVSVAAGATLGGGGNIAGLVSTDGVTSVIRAGGVTNVLTLAGGLNASLGATFDASLGTTSTRVDIGAFTGGNAAGSLRFDIANDGGMETGVIYTIFTFTSATGLDYPDLALGEQSISAGYVLDADFGNGGWQINVDSVQVRFSALGSTIPEPSSFALLAGAAIGASVLLRRSPRD